VGEGLGLGVVLGLGLGSQVLTSTREVIIWQEVEIWHNIICVNGRERVKEMMDCEVEDFEMSTLQCWTGDYISNPDLD